MDNADRKSKEHVVISSLSQLQQISHKDPIHASTMSSQHLGISITFIQILILMPKSKQRFWGALKSVGLLQTKILSSLQSFSIHFFVGDAFHEQTQYLHQSGYVTCSSAFTFVCSKRLSTQTSNLHSWITTTNAMNFPQSSCFRRMAGGSK